MASEVKRRVKIRLTVDLVDEVPADWDEHLIEFKWNGSSTCMNNILPMLEEQYDEVEDDSATPSGVKVARLTRCMCCADANANVQYVGEISDEEYRDMQEAAGK
jgi:hypothetical protein